MKKKVFFYILMAFFIFEFSFILFAADNNTYQENLIEKIKIPAKSFERMALYTENKYLQKVSSSHVDFEFRLQKYIIKRVCLYNETEKIQYSNWIIINREKEIEDTIELNLDSLILMCKENYILARNEDQLLYIPVNNGLFLQRENIYCFSEEYIQELMNLKEKWGEVN